MSHQVIPIPEPGGIALAAAGLAGLVVTARRRTNFVRYANRPLMRVILCLLAILLTHLSGERTMADHYGQPIDNSFVAFSIPETPPDDVYEVFFYSEAAASHRKQVVTSTTLFATESQPASATFWFAWRDTIDSLTTHLSEPYQFSIPAGGKTTFSRLFIIPSAPPLVGIRIQNSSLNQAIAANGSMSHQVIPIPEPGGIALAAAGLAGLAVTARRRTNVVRYANRPLVRVILCLLAILLTHLSGERAMADHYGPLLSNVYVAFSIPETPPDNVYEVFFASEVAVGHRKSVVTATTLHATESRPANATVWLTWRDTVDSLTTHLSEPFNFNIPAGDRITFNRAIVIPYAPPVVGIRIRNDSIDQPIVANGGLTHQVIPIPEPCGIALAAAGLAGLAVTARRYANRPLMRVILCLLATILLTHLSGERAMADHDGPLFSSTFAAFRISETPPDNVYQVFFATEVVPGHRKRVDNGTTLHATESQPASATVWLTWRDTVDSAVTHLSEPYNFNIPAGGKISFVRSIIIPYTPPLLGIRIQNNSGNQPIVANGGLDHQTIPVPEPGTLALAAAGLAGLAATARRRL